MNIKFKIAVLVVMCCILCLGSSLPVAAYVKPNDTSSSMSSYRIDATTCIVCGKPINGDVGESSSIAWALHLDVCEVCFLQIFYGNDVTTSILKVSQLGEDGKVLPEQLPASQGGTVWGAITGTLSAQTDLAGALDSKLSTVTGTALDNVFSSNGLLKRTGTATYTLDSSTYLTGNQNITLSGDLSGSGTTSISSNVTGIRGKVLPSLATGYLYYNGSAWAFQTPAGGTHNLLDGSTHLDTTVGTVARGDIITGQGVTPKWTKLLKGTANQVLSMDGTGTDIVWATPAGGGESEVIVIMPGDVANSTTTLANATGMTFTADANSEYIIEGFIVWNSSVTTVGIKLSATASGSPTSTMGHFETDAANGTPDSSSYNANDVVVTTGASAFTTNNVGKLSAMLNTAASSSTWQLRFAAETTGTITMQGGSVLRYRKVGGAK